MSFVQVELEDAVYEQLKAEAVERNMTVAAVLGEIAALAAQGRKGADEARAAARRHLERYPRMFERLAK